MATYREIQGFVKTSFGYVPKSCWIAHCKEIYGLAPKVSPNRHDTGKRVYPCPEDKKTDILRAFQHFGMFGADK